MVLGRESCLYIGRKQTRREHKPRRTPYADRTLTPFLLNSSLTVQALYGTLTCIATMSIGILCDSLWDGRFPGDFSKREGRTVSRWLSQMVLLAGIVLQI